MKKIRSLMIAFAFILICACPIVFSGCGPSANVAKVTFAGFTGVQELVAGKDYSKAEIPTYTLDDKTLIGWSTSENATTALIPADSTDYHNTVIKYETVENYLNTNKEITLYGVYQGFEIALTIVNTNGTPFAPIKLNSVTKNVVTPTLTLAAKQELIGWATSETATVPNIMAGVDITYSTVKSLASNGAVTLYPILHTYDIVVAVWDHWFKSSTDFTGDQVVSAIEQEFQTTADILYRHYTPSNADDLGDAVDADGDVDVVIGAGGTVKDKVSNVLAYKKQTKFNTKTVDGESTDGKRYAALLTLNDNSTDFYAYMTGQTSKKATVTIMKDAEDTVGVTTDLYSVANNVAELPEISPQPEKILVGFTRTTTATGVEIEEVNITYDHVKNLTGEIILYPFFDYEYDLFVAIWAVNSGSSGSVYATQEQVDAMSTAFAGYLEDIDDSLRVKYYMVSGTTSTYPNNIPAKTMVILSGPNVVTDNSSIGKYKVINLTTKFTSTRYASFVNETIAADTLANLFVDFFCDTKIEITFNVGQTPTTVTVSDIHSTTATVPTVEPAAGLTFFGWATTANAEIPAIPATATTLGFNDVKDLATNGAVSLYPVCLESKDLVVTFNLDAECKQTLNNISKNVAELTTLTIEQGKELKGWSTTEGATEDSLISSPTTSFGAKLTLNYANLIGFVTEGTSLTLYPIIGKHYDLVVSVYGVAKKTTTIYMTEEQLTAIEIGETGETGFKAYYNANKETTDPAYESLSIKWIRFTGGVEADYEASVTKTNSNNQVNGVDLTISRTVLKDSNTQTYSTDYHGAINSKIAVTDTSPVGTGIIAGHENKYAIMLYTYLTTPDAAPTE